jgi:hypothetical protein
MHLNRHEIPPAWPRRTGSTPSSRHRLSVMRFSRSNSSSQLLNPNLLTTKSRPLEARSNLPVRYRPRCFWGISKVVRSERGHPVDGSRGHELGLWPSHSFFTRILKAGLSSTSTTTSPRAPRKRNGSNPGITEGGPAPTMEDFNRPPPWPLPRPLIEAADNWQRPKRKTHQTVSKT